MIILHYEERQKIDRITIEEYSSKEYKRQRSQIVHEVMQRVQLRAL